MLYGVLFYLVITWGVYALKIIIAFLSAFSVALSCFAGCSIEIDKSRFQAKDTSSISSAAASKSSKTTESRPAAQTDTESGGDTKNNVDTDSFPFDTSQYLKMYVTGDESVPVFKNEDGTDEFASLGSGEAVYRISSGITDFSFVYSESLSDGFGYIDGYYLTPNPQEVTRGETYYVTEDNTPAYNDDNHSDELFRLDRNTAVTVMSKRVTNVWLVRNQGNGVYGYVDNNMLSEKKLEEKAESKSESSSRSHDRIIGDGDAPDSGYTVYLVTVEDGFLALRSEAYFDDSNILCEMYYGEEVYVIERSGTYWYVYSPKHHRYGYANGEYLKER